MLTEKYINKITVTSVDYCLHYNQGNTLLIAKILISLSDIPTMNAYL